MQQIDLEELIEQCASPRAKTYIREAVDCYTVGAYRACVITTWVSVVYDIVDKLRDLSLTGDKQAAAKVQEFEEINEKRDLDAALKFERDILGIAQAPFEFLTAYEALEIARLQDDRNRCAHPNLVREDEVYRPTPELARLHMRNAVDLVLKCPPVQGKAALGLIQQEVDSQYFPTTADAALEVLRLGPIARARQNLIRKFIYGALVSCIKEKLSAHKISQRIAAFSAVRRLHPHVTEELLKDGIEDVFSNLGDDQLGRAIYVLYRIPDLLPFLSEATVQKLNTYVSTMPNGEVESVLPSAFGCAEFCVSAETRLGPSTDASLKALVDVFLGRGEVPPPPIIETAVSRYETSGSFDIANRRIEYYVRPLVPVLDRTTLERMIRAGTNYQIRGSYRFGVLLGDIKTTGKIPPEVFDQILVDANLTRDYPGLLYKAPEAQPPAPESP